MKYDVSIGIPVYNGEDLLENTLSELVKHLPDIREIIISDNASTDKTPDICKKFAEKYPKIKYIRQEHYMSAMDNWKEALKPAEGKYFMWIGHHDLISDNYFSETVPLLENNTDAVAAMPFIRAFTFSKGLENLILRLDPTKLKIDSTNRRERIYSVLAQGGTCYVINQLFKIEIIRKIAKECFIREYVNSDHIVALLAVLYGKVMQAPKTSYYYLQRENESEKDTLKRYVAYNKLDSLSNNHKRYLPKLYWELCQKYAADVSDELLKTDINFVFCLFWGINASDDDWIARRIAFSPKEKAPNDRAYSAIYTALNDEKICDFYRNLRFGKKSMFEPLANEVAQNSYARMLEILINEKYLFPQYKLTQEETKMLNELTLLKSKEKV